MTNHQTFGEFFKELRGRNKHTLRHFCSENGFDPSNVSKLERGIFPAPENEEKLEEYARALNLKKGTSDWIKFFDLASVSRKTFSAKNIEDPEIVHLLPVLFRTIENKNVTAEDLDQLIKLIKSDKTTE